MTQAETNITEEMKRYLFHEASAGEREVMEKRFFTDSNFFYEVTDLENDLIDRYARGELESGDRKRFEQSLSKLPARREKIANAAALQKFIAEEKPSKIVPAAIVPKEKQTFWQTVSSFFDLRMPVLQFAGAAMMVLLTIGIGFLLFERARTNQELARLRDGQSGRIIELEKQENALQEQIRQTREREQNLQNKINDERGQSDILDSQLERERAEKQRLESEMEILRKEKGKLAPVQPKENAPQTPTIATVFLSPISGGKGGGSGDVKTIRINPKAAKIVATLQIPTESTAESFSVKLEGAPIAENLKPQKTRQGNKFINVAFPSQWIAPNKENLITVIGNDQSRYNYVFRMQK